MNREEIAEYINQMPDEVISHFSAAHHSGYEADEVNSMEERKRAYGFSINLPSGVKTISQQYKYLQQTCWEKFCDNPQIRTAIIDTMGRLTGYGFTVTSDIPEIQEVIDLISNDPRNRLHTMLPKWEARADIEGELFIVMTIHDDGFIELDFRDPGMVGGLNTDTGILTLPTKPSMPLVYCFEGGTDLDGNTVPREQIPSIFALRYPDTLRQLRQTNFRAMSLDLLEQNRSSKPQYRPFGGYFRCVIAWDKGFMTSRNLGHLRTVIKWVNLYESLKMYEIDHKRSSGSFLWTFTFDDPRAYKLWMALTPEERAATGILASKKPGGSLILPPGMKLEVHNPTLPKISDSDTDILSMIGSGLNTTTSMMMGTEQATFASAKASKGPMTDRTKDAIAWFERFLRYDLWDNIFWVRSQMGLLNATYPNQQCVGFKGKKPVMKRVQVPCRDLIEFTFPVSELADGEAMAKAMLGVKHGSLADTLGIPMSELSKRMGMGNYRRLRQLRAAEQELYPELFSPDDQEQQQEKENNDSPGSAK